MSSSASELHGVAPGLGLRLSLPAGARDVPKEALPAIDVSALGGARVTLLRGVEADAAGWGGGWGAGLGGGGGGGSGRGGDPRAARARLRRERARRGALQP